MSRALDVAAREAASPRTGSRVPTGAVTYVLIAFLVAKSAAPVRDADTFWHVAAGRQILRDRALAGPDPLSPFTLSPWIRHAWLPDVAFELLDRTGGPALLAVALPLMTAVALTTIYVVLRQFAGRLLSAVLLGLTFLTMSGSISLRPQVISFAGTAAVTGLWLLWARGGRLPWVVVPLTWMWACCHGLWMVSPVIGLAVVAGSALDNRSLTGSARPALVAVASAVAGALTPVGPALLLAPLQVRVVAPFIQEWQRDPLTSLPLCALWAILILAVVACVVLRRRPPWTHVALVTLALVLGLSAGRTVGIAGIIAACTVAGTVQQATPLDREAWSRSELLRTLGAGAIGIALGAALILSGPRTVSGYPSAPFQALKATPAGTVVCTEYEAGSWLLWMHPGLVPTVDGRTEIYRPSQLRAAQGLANGSPGADRSIRESSGCRYALVRTGGPGARLLGEQNQLLEANGELSLYELTSGSGTR